MNSVKRFHQRVTKGLKQEKQESAATGIGKRKPHYDSFLFLCFSDFYSYCLIVACQARPCPTAS